MTQLKSAGVAHGDLHHGNVLVDDEGEITLVDYDGFYVPAMHDKPPGEVGHPNYQLPERIENGYYEANADAFSSLLIYVTILAVRSDREIWAHHNGDNLIFVDQDFKSLGWPGVWTQLRQNPDPEVRRLSRLLEQFCKLPPASLPDLSTVVNNEVEVVAGAAQVIHQT
jgi:eukaryotic-like serine/threonine-protein kinase